MLEALFNHQDGSATVDARAASEAELVEVLGVAHGCIYKAINSGEVTQQRLNRGWIKRVEIYDQDGFRKAIHLHRIRMRKPD